MANCCSTDYRRMFSRKFAARDLRRYRERGLANTERDLVSLVGDVQGETVLEAGGGIGALQLELLDAGAAAATNVELSGGYEDASAQLFAEREVDRRVGDFVSEDLEPHDVVVMHRVVCCYPDPEALVGAAAARTRRVLALTLPQERHWVGWGLGAVNLWLRIRGCGFRTYHHPFARVEEAASANGLRLSKRVRRGLIWESAAFVR